MIIKLTQALRLLAQDVKLTQALRLLARDVQYVWASQPHEFREMIEINGEE